MFNKIKSLVTSTIEYEFKDKNGFITNNIGKLFIFFHFIMGFFCLWLTYFQLSMIVKAHGDPLFWKSGLETAYLVVGVFWGNIGWDFYSNIKKGVSASVITDYMVNFSAPGVFVFPIVVSIIQAIVGVKQEGVFWGYYQLTSSTFWFAVIALILFRFAAKYRTLNKAIKSDSDAHPL
ncbi:hypothetical protein [Psychromonas sp. KJ10-2]|uniref:hypothetical protein n=1 Tax=Psychromonas sp. KJ10-2 TaxID=3391822 RepID=UPI0039B43447